MSLTRSTGGQITLNEAKTLTESFQTNHPYENKCYFMGAEHIQAILNQPGCIGIRVYKGFDKETDKKTIILVGVDGDCKDMTSGVIADRAIACPSDCDSSSQFVF